MPKLARCAALGWDNRKTGFRRGLDKPPPKRDAQNRPPLPDRIGLSSQFCHQERLFPDGAQPML